MFFNFDPLSFQVLSVKTVRHPDGFFSVPPRPFAAIAIRADGEGAFKVGNTSFTAQKGDVTFFPSNEGYEVEYNGSEIYVIHLNDCNYTDAENIHLKHPNYILSLFKDIYRQWESKQSANMSKSNVYHLLSKIEEDSFSNIDDNFLKCNLYIQEHFSEWSLKISDVCRYGSLSEATLYRYFMSYYGISPKQYIQKLRLNSAIELLLGGDMPISQIALASGFRDPKYFSRVFSEHFCVPPSEYREPR